MNHTVMRNLHRVPTEVDLVVGIPRSGLLAANMIALYLNLPLTDMEGLREGRLMAKGKRQVRNHASTIFQQARKILIVDDCVSQGTEMNKARQAVKAWGYADRACFATVYSFPERIDTVDLVFETVARPACFQWSCMHTPELRNHCVDIDGILCADPTKEQDDDGPAYEAFLQNAKPLFIPTAEVGWLVTCRLEKYRELTEAWLARHNVRYHHLIMMPAPDKATRDQQNQHAVFKAHHYRKCGASLFIESSPGLARQIADLSHRPVMCLDTGSLVRPPASERFDIQCQRLYWWGRRLRRAPRRLAASFLNTTSPRRNAKLSLRG
jgi:uncharacterized HAD superfamily protein/hypoxanthine phosphoribosyltransferase